MLLQAEEKHLRKLRKIKGLAEDDASQDAPEDGAAADATEARPRP